MHACQFAKVRFCDVYIEGLALVNVGTSIGSHVDEGTLRDLPDSLVKRLQIIRDLLDLLQWRETRGQSNNFIIKYICAVNFP